MIQLRGESLLFPKDQDVFKQGNIFKNESQFSKFFGNCWLHVIFLHPICSLPSLRIKKRVKKKTTQKTKNKIMNPE